MRIIDGLKDIVYKSDLLSSANFLRVKGEPQFQTLFGGFISISLMIILGVAFYNKIIDTFNRVLITASATSTNADDPSSFMFNTIGNGPFMFGVEVWHHNLNTDKRYFDVTLVNTFYQYGGPTNASIQYNLEPCRKDHWDGYPEIQNKFQQLQMNYWVCLPKSMSFEIKGKYSSVQSKTVDVAVKKCTNNSFQTRPCASDEQISSIFIENDGPMFFTIYFINPLINAQSELYLSYYLQDSNYIAFSQKGGQESRLFIEDYEIDTDESIFPLMDSKVEFGGMVSSSPLKSTYTQLTDTYAVFFFYKSPISKVYNRSFQKLDDVFSYIGGLFGTILIIFFLVSSYNTYKFQINISGYLYTTDSKDKQLEKNYHFGHFLGQMLYSILIKFNCNPHWQKLKYYYQTREEALKQLDILFLFKRINFLEKSLSIIFNDSQLKGLHLSSRQTINEAVSIRRRYKLKSKIKDKIEGTIMKRIKPYEPRDQFDQNISCEILKDQKDRTQGENKNNDNFNSDCYTSEQQSSDEQNILGPILQLKKECQQNPISNKIWNNMDIRLKELIKPIFNRQIQQQEQRTAKEEFQQHKIENDLNENNPNLFLFLDPNIEELNEQSQNEKNYIFAKQTFAKIKPIHKSSLEIHDKQK